MTEPAYIGNNLWLALVAGMQRVLPAAIVVTVLYLVAGVYGVPYDEYLRALAVISGGLSLAFLRVRRNGRPLMMTPLLHLTARLIGRWLGVLALVLLVGFLTQFHARYPLELICGWALFAPLAFAPVVVGLHILKRRIAMDKTNIRTAVCAGLTPHSMDLAAKLRGNPELCTEFIGFFDDRSLDRLGAGDRADLLGELTDLGTYVRKYRVDVIFIALPIRHLERVMNLIDDLKDSTASIYYLPDVFVFDLIQSRPGEIMGLPVISLCETPFYGSRGVLKRISDVLLTLVALIPSLPVMAVVALLVRLTSPGPVIFKQRRYGLDGHEIVVYKFRTMRVLEDGEEIVQVSKVDPRVTSIGRILRTYSLDELPQLFNVLQGRMSLVGPRPHAVSHNEEYRKLIKGYMLRHKVLPGITGLAQVSGYRGEIEKLEDMEGRVSYDLEYLRKWTPLLDLKILFLTVLRVFRDSKAY